jgi:hypothetical protein
MPLPAEEPNFSFFYRLSINIGISNLVISISDVAVSEDNIVVVSDLINLN